MQVGKSGKINLYSDVTKYIKGSNKPLLWLSDDPIFADFINSSAYLLLLFVYAGNGYFYSATA
jgi:hypothetical protein